jgi:ribose 1,5-bisphosphokinase
MNLRLIYVMGPSGAGKDSVLGWLRANLPPGIQVHWAQRTITRPASAGGEAHEAIDAEGFEHLRSQGAFALAWQANGLHYGIRHTELARLQQGHWVLVNGSRGHLPHALQSHPGLQVVHITADPATLTQRLTQTAPAQKGRAEAGHACYAKSKVVMQSKGRGHSRPPLTPFAFSTYSSIWLKFRYL